jgi:hypothetical protein
VKDRLLHITAKELQSCVNCLTQVIVQKDMSSCTIHVRTDNLTALSYLRRRVGRMRHLNRIMLPLLKLLKTRHIFITAEHLAGILNTLADRLSRIRPQVRDPSGWCLRSPLFTLIQEFFQEKITLDLFASPQANLLPRFGSRVRTDKGCLGTAWDLIGRMNQEFTWVHPPFNLILDFLQQFREIKGAWCLLVYPDWQSSPWFPILTRLLIHSRELPRNCLFIPEALHPRWHKLAHLKSWTLHLGLLYSDGLKEQLGSVYLDLWNQAPWQDMASAGLDS